MKSIETTKMLKELETTETLLIKKHKYLDDLRRLRWYVIDTRQSKPYEIWYYIVMLSAVVNSIWTPLTISFDYAI